ncbi:PHD-zinc-finger like domain-containing protein [Elsinoe fawcettii]|nr:PHD-zinc-finger like domain-containing protein [Elsinoe fawcettii]
MAIGDEVEPPKKRGPGRPRKHPLPEGQEPPPKKRKYIGKTPDRGRRRADDDGDFKTPRTIIEGDSADELATTTRTRTGHSTPARQDDNPVSPKTLRDRTASRSRRTYARARSRGRTNAAPRPRYSSAAAAAAASQASDGYKPREERSWEEFHPDLDIEAELMIYTADEVDGRVKAEQKPSGLRMDTTNVESEGAGLGIDGMNGEDPGIEEPETPGPVKRKPGRPPRRPESMLSGLGSPPAPRILPLPTHNPKERLNLPKPSYRHVQTFKMYEEDKKVRLDDYVDKAMANVGYQESERFEIPSDILIRHSEAAYDDELGAGLTLESDDKEKDQPTPQLGDVEYDMDEQDERWLEMYNAKRKEQQVGDAIKPAIFEITMTQIEREHYALEKRIPKPNPRHANQTRPRSSSAAAVNGEPWGAGDEPDSKCAICDDGDCENANAIIFCDGCDLAVHQECYGVPFIPEGQWFCRKCKEIGRGTPTCIFCPNIEGAFKQTNTLRWSHLLCAIWIPEVSIANPTYMEPIQDVEKVPRNRWSLVCYICDQRMGACIQCSNKVCYQAFHVTCARRARLFLKMKATPTSGIDTSILKAFCDKHVPPEWRRDHDTDQAIVDAKRYYRKTMRNRKWADSQTAALSLATNEQLNAEPTTEVDPPDDKSTIVVGGTKRKKKDAQKAGWRLPSGAPVVPAVVFNAVEQSLQRFTLRKRKDFVAEACKYWTLKREARRGAALLKRLQLQLESSSSMEITRRNFVGMGAAGRPRLVRRIEFAELLKHDIVGLKSLVETVTQREAKKLEDAENLRRLIDTVYFPVSDLLWPILRKAQKLGEKSRIFEEGLAVLERKLLERQYASVNAFSTDITALFQSIIAKPDLDVTAEDGRPRDISDLHAQIVPLSYNERQALSADQKQQKTVAKRIVRAIKEPLEQALRKEADLHSTSEDRTTPTSWADIGAKLESAVAAPSDQGSIHPTTSVNGDGHTRHRNDSDVSASVAGGASPTGIAPSRNGEVESSPQLIRNAKSTKGKEKDPPVQAPSPPISADSSTSNPIDPTSSSATSAPSVNAKEKEEGVLASGGTPWYMRAFSPIGTSFTEPAGLDTDEELSDVDEAKLKGADLPAPTPGKKNPSPKKAAATGAKKRDRTASTKKKVPAKDPAETPATTRSTRTRAGSIAGSTAPSVAGSSVNGSTRASRSRANGDGRKASTQVDGGAVDGDGDTNMPDAAGDGKRASRRSTTAKKSAEEEDVEVKEPKDEAQLAREKRDAYNARRREQRRLHAAAVREAAAKGL